jgi:hypothetical protein
MSGLEFLSEFNEDPNTGHIFTRTIQEQLGSENRITEYRKPDFFQVRFQMVLPFEALTGFQMSFESMFFSS